MEGLDVLAEAMRRVAARERVVLATVTETWGSTPRKPGARMLVGEAGLLAGTVGGGRFEAEILARARDLLPRGGTLTVDLDLTHALGQCCGGRMRVFLEVLAPAERLLLFGAGHVAQALAPLAKGVGFAVWVVDERPAFLTRERFPDADVLLDTADPLDWKGRLAIDRDTYCVVTTHDHGLDQRIVQALLDGEAAYVGLIGSRAKRARFAARLSAWGVSPERLARLRSPVGVAIGAETPAEIALSIAAELVAARRRAREEAAAGDSPSAPAAAAR